MNKIAYLDLDGVIVDFVAGAMAVLDLPADARFGLHTWNSLDDLVPGGREEVWSKIDAKGEAFWADLPRLPVGWSLFQEIIERDIPFVFVTSPSRHHDSCAGKARWLFENIPHRDYQGKPMHRRFALCPAKHLIAHADAILVDDRRRNTDRFVQAGGDAVLWPQPWNDPTIKTIEELQAKQEVAKRLVLRAFE